MYHKELDYNLLEDFLERVNREEIYLEILEADQACVKGRKYMFTIFKAQKKNDFLDILNLFLFLFRLLYDVPVKGSCKALVTRPSRWDLSRRRDSR